MSIKIKTPDMPEMKTALLRLAYGAKDSASVEREITSAIKARDAQWLEMVGPVIQAAAQVMARHEKEIAGRICSEYIELAELRKQLAALSAITEEQK